MNVDSRACGGCSPRPLRWLLSGLAALALCCLSARPATAQGRAYSAEAIARLVTGGANTARILELTRAECVGFIMDEAADRLLRRAGADEGLIAGLRGTCYIGPAIDVSSEPPGAEVLVNGQSVGKTPITIPVKAAPAVAVEVRYNGAAKSITTAVPADRVARLRFDLPRDTLPWPVGRSAREFGEEYGLLDSWRSTLPKPEVPRAPRGWRKTTRLGLGLAMGAGAGFAATRSTCARSLPSKTVDGKTYPAVPLGVDPACSTPTMAGAALVGGVALMGIAKLRHDGRVRGYRRATAAYPQRVADWENAKIAERDLWLQNQPRIRAALAEQEQRLSPERERRQQENAKIAERNAQLVEPVAEMLLAAEVLATGEMKSGGSGFAELRSDVDTLVPRGRERNPNAVAVVIGNRNYTKSGVPAVEYALRDAQSVRRYLTETMGFSPENIIFEADAGKADIERIFGTAGRERGQLYNFLRGRESDVFVYYAGHGAPNLETKKGYLVPSDADPNYIALNGYPVEQLFENLAKLPARSLTVVLDACFSGSSERGSLLKGMSAGGLLQIENPILAVENGMLFTASAADEVSSWYDQQGHGLFTYFFLKGIQGAADANGDRAITAGELQGYVADRVSHTAQRARNRVQTPQFTGRDLERVVVRLADSDGAK